MMIECFLKPVQKAHKIQTLIDARLHRNVLLSTKLRAHVNKQQRTLLQPNALVSVHFCASSIAKKRTETFSICHTAHICCSGEKCEKFSLRSIVSYIPTSSIDLHRASIGAGYVFIIKLFTPFALNETTKQGNGTDRAQREILSGKNGS